MKAALSGLTAKVALMSTPSPIPSLLSFLTSRPMFRESVEYGAMRYAETKYQHRTNILTYQGGDGMACHGWFNRGFAEKFARLARRAHKRIQFVVKKKNDIRYIGDIVCVSKFKGQTRFDVSLDDKVFQLLHMTGEIDSQNMTLEVYEIGKARTEYLKNQSSRVKAPTKATLFDPNPDNFEMTVDDDKPTRIILVTEVTPLKDKVVVWACIPTKAFGVATGVIELAELEKICEKPITGKSPQFIVTPKPAQPGHGIKVTPKKKA